MTALPEAVEKMIEEFTPWGSVERIGAREMAERLMEPVCRECGSADCSTTEVETDHGGLELVLGCNHDLSGYGSKITRAEFYRRNPR